MCKELQSAFWHPSPANVSNKGMRYARLAAMPRDLSRKLFRPASLATRQSNGLDQGVALCTLGRASARLPQRTPSSLCVQPQTQLGAVTALEELGLCWIHWRCLQRTPTHQGSRRSASRQSAAPAPRVLSLTEPFWTRSCPVSISKRIWARACPSAESPTEVTKDEAEGRTPHPSYGRTWMWICDQCVLTMKETNSKC